MILGLLSGFVFGVAFAIVLRLFIVDRREKRGKLEAKYASFSLSAKLKAKLREVYFKFAVARFNRDFVLNIRSNGEYLIQLIHRAHFPELCKESSDAEFGFALYIPTKILTQEKKIAMEKLLEQEAEVFFHWTQPADYFVVDLGIRTRSGGYLMARIIKEIFGREFVEFELYDEGILPFHITH